MTEIEDKNTRYFIDLDLRTRVVVRWGFGQKTDHAIQRPPQSFLQRVFISKGQYNKLEMKDSELKQEAKNSE